MKFYTILCPQCRWSASMIDEKAAEKFQRLRYCQDCKKANRPPAVFLIHEHITSTRKGW